MISGKTKKKKIKTHLNSFDLDTIPQYILHEGNEAFLKFDTMPKKSPRSKHIGSTYHFFRINVEKHEIVVIGFSTYDQLAAQFTKVLTLQLFIESRKRLMRW